MTGPRRALGGGRARKRFSGNRGGGINFFRFFSPPLPTTPSELYRCFPAAGPPRTPRILNDLGRGLGYKTRNPGYVRVPPEGSFFSPTRGRKLRRRVRDKCIIARSRPSEGWWWVPVFASYAYANNNATYVGYLPDVTHVLANK